MCDILSSLLTIPSTIIKAIRLEGEMSRRGIKEESDGDKDGMHKKVWLVSVIPRKRNRINIMSNRKERESKSHACIILFYDDCTLVSIFLCLVL